MIKNLQECFRTNFVTEWNVPHEILEVSSEFFLRYFRGQGLKRVLIVPPMAGHDSTICLPLVNTLRSKANLYVIDWRECTDEWKNCGIEDIVNIIKNVVVKKEIDTLIGLCAGGWQSAIVASIQPVDRLIIAGSPIDASVNCDLKTLTETLPLGFFETMVNYHGGIMSGDLMLLGWKSSNIYDRYFKDYFDIMMADDKTLKKIHNFRSWYNKPQDIAGKYYLEAIENIFMKNQLFNGELELFGEKINLNNIHSEVISIAGENDDITPIESAHALGGHKIVIPNVGHIGIFMSSKSQPYWAELF